jgi:hypothetical protein
MPDYDSEFFNPPAPVAYVNLRNPENNVEIANVPMLLDTGADATLIPQIFVDKAGLILSPTGAYEIESFDKTVSYSSIVRLQMIFEGRSFRGEFLTVNQNYGIIGRNVLNSIKIEFDGQNLRWKIL